MKYIPGPLRLAILKNEYPNSTLYTSLDLWHEVEFSNIFDYDFSPDISELLKDSSLASPFSEWLSNYDPCAFSNLYGKKKPKFPTGNKKPKDDPLYNFTQGSRQFIKRRCQNVEHSGCPVLCDVTYRQLREYAPRITREMPYTAFLHAMNTTLQAFIIDTVRNLNQEPRWQDEDQPFLVFPGKW